MNDLPNPKNKQVNNIKKGQYTTKHITVHQMLHTLLFSFRQYLLKPVQRGKRGKRKAKSDKQKRRRVQAENEEKKKKRECTRRKGGLKEAKQRGYISKNLYIKTQKQVGCVEKMRHRKQTKRKNERGEYRGAKKKKSEI